MVLCDGFDGCKLPQREEERRLPAASGGLRGENPRTLSSLTPTTPVKSHQYATLAPFIRNTGERGSHASRMPLIGVGLA